MISELDTVVLAHNIQAYGLKPGDIGAVVHVYQEANALADKGLCQQAGDKIEIANSLEKYRILRDVVVLNQIIKKTSQKFNLNMVSAYAELSNSNINDNFVDPVHPSAHGHEIISSVLLKQVLPLIQ